MTHAQKQAVLKVAEALGWTNYSLHDLGLMMWAAFRYYAIRAESKE
jgi:hypothetical protein